MNSRIVEAAILAVRSLAGLATAKMARRANGVVALLAQQLDEPGLVLRLFLQDARSHVIGARILAKGQIADLAPGADGAALRLEQHRQDAGRRRLGRQVSVRTAGTVGEFPNVAG